jgi:heat-inducible transcriptional repressor
MRLFIDSLLKVRNLSAKEKEEMRSRFGLGGTDLDDAMQRTSRLLAELSQQAAVVITPLPERQRLERVEFVRLRDHKLLAVLVSEGGHVDNKLVSVTTELEQPALDRINNYLNGLIAGMRERTLEDVRAAVLAELGKEKNQVDELAAQALRLGHEALAPAGDALGERDLIVSGQSKLIEVAPMPDQVRALLQTLEEKEGIVRLLDRTLEADGIQVWLGAETPFASVADLSVVASPYGPDDKPVGTIAVIGPTHMNYSKVIPLVDFTAELVTDLLVGGKG